MTTSDGPPQPLVRRGVVDALRRQDQIQRHPCLSWRQRKLLRMATPADRLTADLEELWDTPRVDNLVEMADGRMATLPQDPERP